MQNVGKRLMHAAVAASLALTAPLAAAVDTIGVGVGLINNGGNEGSAGYGVSLPMRFGNITVEPELAFYSGNYEQRDIVTPANNYNGDYHSYTLETGVFMRQQVMPSLETYVGGRVGYTSYESSYGYVSGTNYSDESSGFYIGPTLGAEYFFNKNLSLGLDVSLFYSSRKGESRQNGVVEYKYDESSTYYQTRTRLRYYF